MPGQVAELPLDGVDHRRCPLERSRVPGLLERGRSDSRPTPNRAPPPPSPSAARTGHGGTEVRSAASPGPAARRMPPPAQQEPGQRIRPRRSRRGRGRSRAGRGHRRRARPTTATRSRCRRWRASRCRAGTSSSSMVARSSRGRGVGVDDHPTEGRHADHRVAGQGRTHHDVDLSRADRAAVWTKGRTSTATIAPAASAAHRTRRRRGRRAEVAGSSGARSLPLMAGSACLTALSGRRQTGNDPLTVLQHGVGFGPLTPLGGPCRARGHRPVMAGVWGQRLRRSPHRRAIRLRRSIVYSSGAGRRPAPSTRRATSGCEAKSHSRSRWRPHWP